MDVSPVLMVCLMATAFISGMLNAVAGGGGMLLVPVMLVSGIPPINAIAINKLQNTGANFTSSFQYLRGGFLDLNSSRTVLLYAVLASILGVFALQYAAQHGVLDAVVPYLLIAIALYMASGLKPRQRTKAVSLPTSVGNLLTGGLAGFYGGFFGPGTGPMVVAAFSALRGYELKTAISNSKPVLLVINITSLILLVVGGHVWWLLGLGMTLCGVLGSYLGARIMMKTNPIYLRLLLVVVPLISAIKMLFF